MATPWCLRMSTTCSRVIPMLLHMACAFFCMVCRRVVVKLFTHHPLSLPWGRSEVYVKLHTGVSYYGCAGHGLWICSCYDLTCSALCCPLAVWGMAEYSAWAQAHSVCTIASLQGVQQVVRAARVGAALSPLCVAEQADGFFHRHACCACLMVHWRHWADHWPPACPHRIEGVLG